MNELVQVRPHGADVEAFRASTEAAEICKGIVLASSSTIQGRKFVSVEGWQAIAIAHGCVAGARDVERVEGGVRAIGEVRRMADGQLIATAEGFVGEDEETWFGGKNKWGKELPRRHDYAIRAMAQTRAISRACRSAFAHVVVMMNAGLATTPAEEITTYDDATGEVIEPQPDREKIPGIHKIKGRLRQLQSDGNKAIDLETFNALVSALKDDLQKIKDANHEWWSGDGGDEFEGFKAWIKRRREELAPREESVSYQLLASTLAELTSMNEYRDWYGKHGDVIEQLDGEEGRKFDVLHDEKVSALRLLDQVTVGG